MKIGWSVYIRKLAGTDPYANVWKEIALLDPVPLYDLLKEERSEAVYLRCPALIDYCKDVYVIRSPYDFTLEIDKETGRVEVDKFDQEWFDDNIFVRFPNLKHDKIISLCMTISISYVFFCDEDVEVEVLDVPILSTQLTKNIKIIPGRMNIHRWIRPLDFTFEVQDLSKKLIFRRGDPLFAVKFNTKENIEMTNLEFTDDMYKTVRACLDSRDFIPKKSLFQRYEMAKRFLGKKKWF